MIYHCKIVNKNKELHTKNVIKLKIVKTKESIRAGRKEARHKGMNRECMKEQNEGAKYKVKKEQNKTKMETYQNL